MRRVWEGLLSRPFLAPVFRISHLHCGLIFLRFFFRVFSPSSFREFFFLATGPCENPAPSGAAQFRPIR